MRSLGFLDSALVRDYVREFITALHGDGSLPRFPETATLEDAYAAQRRLVRLTLADSGIAGFKGGVITEAGQRNFGLDRPIAGILPRAGRLNAADKPVVNIAAAPDTIVETEIGYVIDVDISYKVLNDKQARECVRSLVPVIELPVSYARRLGTNTAKDLVASNLGSARFIVGAERSPTSLDADSIELSFKRDGQLLHDASVDSIKHGQWANLRQVLNQLTSLGQTVRAGSLVISGSLGAVHPAQPGKYRAEFGELGTIEFELQK
jgi:2-keto-4-pentenoate hydratase